MEIAKTNRHFREALLETVTCSIVIVNTNEEQTTGNVGSDVTLEDMLS